MKKYWMAGRFQPLHYEHVDLIDRLIEQDNEVSVGIRRTNRISKHNPFYPEEVKDMFYATFGSSVQTFFLTTYNPFKVKEELPKGATFYTRDWFWAAAIKTYGIKVKYEKRRGLSATYIRNMVYNDDFNYKLYVPQPVTDFIKQDKIQKRLQQFKNKKDNLIGKFNVLGAVGSKLAEVFS